MNPTSIQIQSVLYGNDPRDIERAVENLANAARVAQEGGRHALSLTLRYGDASKDPVFSQKKQAEIAQTYDALHFEYVLFGENTGTAKGHNRLAQGCEADYIMIMNPDVVVNPRIFAQLLAPFESQQDVGVTEARQTPIEHGKEYDKKTGDTSWISTACALISTEAFKQVEGFDASSFFMYCDDLDFSWRLRLAGYRAIYVPGAPVYHAKRLSADAKWVPTRAEVYYSAEAALMLAHKWSNPERVQKLLAQYLRTPPGGDEHKAALAFQHRQQQGTLAPPLDPGHTVASFTREGYGEYRFMMDM